MKIKTTELCTLKLWILWYVCYMLKRKKKASHEVILSWRVIWFACILENVRSAHRVENR